MESMKAPDTMYSFFPEGDIVIKSKVKVLKEKWMWQWFKISIGEQQWLANDILENFFHHVWLVINTNCDTNQDEIHSITKLGKRHE